ncbi:MAG: hypothetical protein ACFFEF_18200 [Candidatus Thorarchaeota archaeon]
MVLAFLESVSILIGPKTPLLICQMHIIIMKRATPRITIPNGPGFPKKKKGKIKKKPDETPSIASTRRMAPVITSRKPANMRISLFEFNI